LAGLLPVFPFLLLPTFFGFAGGFLQLTRGFSSALLGVTGDFVSRLASLKRGRVAVAFGVALSIALLIMMT
jgi:hypothetical protein